MVGEQLNSMSRIKLIVPYLVTSTLVPCWTPEDDLSLTCQRVLPMMASLLSRELAYLECIDSTAKQKLDLTGRLQQNGVVIKHVMFDEAQHNMAT